MARSVVECLSLDRRVAGLSLPRCINCLVSMSKTFYPLLNAGSSQEDPSDMT